MKLLRTLALIASCVAVTACKSGGAPSSEVPCTCGQPAADMDGCAHATCLAGKRNPENPDCVCGSLTIPK